MTLTKILFIFFILIKVHCDDQTCSKYIKYDWCDCGEGPVSFDGRYCITCAEPKKIIDQFCYTPVDHCQKYYDWDDLCKTCEAGYKMNDKGQCIECPSRKVGSLNYCYKKIEHCVDYDLLAEGEKCMTCENGYVAAEENTKCEKQKEIIENCNNINSKNICTECKSGYELYDNGLKCIKKCDDISKLAPFGECIPRLLFCSTYKSDNTCEKCMESYELKDNTCTKCSSGFGDGKTCFPKIEGCDLQTGEKCLKCNDQYKKSDDEKSCEKCPDDKVSLGADNKCYDKINNCAEISIEDYYSCKICEKNYFLSEDHLSCTPCENNLISGGLKCGEKIDNCEEIDENNLCNYCKIDKHYYLTTGRSQCNECGRGKYLFNGECIDEIPNCVYYSSKTECSQCSEDYKIVNGKCVYCHYPYFGTNGKTCHLYRYLCQKHDDNGNCIKYVEGYTPKETKDKEATKNNALPLMIIISVIVLFALLILIKPF